jgi:Tol biopolymer transport system component
VAADQDGSGPWLWAFDVERKVSRRVSFGLERYTSIAASADGRRLVAAVANPVAGLWGIPILDHPVEESEVKPYSVPNVRALMPRYGGKSLFYLSSQGGGDGLWRWEDGHASEVWKGAQGTLLEPPAISADGRQAAVVLRRNGRRSLHLVAADGSEVRPLTEAVDVRGAAAWSPDGKWLVTGGNDGKGAGLFKIPLDGGAPVRLVTGAALNPAWSPDGSVIAYSGASVAGKDSVFAVRPEGGSVDPLPIQVVPNGERLRFLPDNKGLVYMRGTEANVDFWLLDLATKQSRQLTRLNNPATMRTFDITRDGKQIVFDRMRENSDIVLIDLPRKP